MPDPAAPRSVAPLSSRVTLGQLLNHVRVPGACGVWVDGPLRPPSSLQLRVHTPDTALDLVLSADLGLLIRRTCRVLVRRGGAVACLDVGELDAIRCLEVALAGGTPVLHPLHHTSPEAVLAGQAALGAAVTGSRVRYLG